ncbi:transposase [Mangrovicoccus sp. HB161399]|uniref:transposase n=1 Tax=Mangrovicoccus sp. HB161399 TaxID=2720392 RepID=UPI001C131958|nr:transposase [Mangrovicoccus sp. HB161399]
MSRQPRRRFAAGFREQAVARLSGPGATQAGVARELGVSASQLKGWRPELAAAGPAGAIRRQQAGAAELSDLRRPKEEAAVMRTASASARSLGAAHRGATGPNPMGGCAT